MENITDLKGFAQTPLANQGFLPLNIFMQGLTPEHETGSE